MRTALVILSLMCLVGVAQAGVIVGNMSVEWDKTTVTPNAAAQFIDGDYNPVYSGQVDVYTVRMRSLLPGDANSFFAGYDGKFVPTGAGSAILQQFYFNEPSNVTPDLFFQASMTPGTASKGFFPVDSHINYTAAKWVTQVTPYESAGTAANGYLDGNLGVVAAMKPEYRTSNFSFAQIVVPTGKSFKLQGYFTDGGANKIGGYNDILIPEPASLSVLALGAIGMIVRRRRA